MPSGFVYDKRRARQLSPTLSGFVREQRPSLLLMQVFLLQEI
jgi:hypothetical protein